MADPKDPLLKEKLGLTSTPARLATKLENGEVVCGLSPRRCRLRPGQAGFCRVRANENGELVTLNFGVSVEMTQEMIETEAVAHFAPGAPILSLGNIGCMLNCDFCHNWKTSQMRFVERKDIHHYTPEEVVETALSKGIRILSWTYNDPVVWHEFVVETARLARSRGLMNLYKSAFYITPEAIEELHEVIDIFSLSLKSMDPEFYRRVARGKLQPVLDGIKQVHRYGTHHLELSNLVVTGRNDRMEELEKVVDWMLRELDPAVPLHIVRFHPDYQYTHVGRTDVGFLKRARLRALEMGLQHVYLGNVYEEHEGLNTFCAECDTILVRRFGLQTELVGLLADGTCRECRAPGPIRGLGVATAPPAARPRDGLSAGEFTWRGDVNACHVTVRNAGPDRATVLVDQGLLREIALAPGESWRFIASRRGKDEAGVRVLHPESVELHFREVLDRAHFPTEETSPS